MPSDDDIPYINRAHLRWNENDLLGEGSFGRVFRGQLHGTPVAIKVVKRAISLSSNDLSDDQRQEEIAALRQHRREIHRFKVVQNPHIIQYLGVFRDADPRDLYIVTEYLEGGSLHDSLEAMRSRNAILYDRSFLQIARHIAYGLNHVHAEGYTHGDVKPQNILLSSKFQFSEVSPGRYVAHIAESVKVKIADFGLSKRLDSGSSTNLIASTVAGGTVDFGNGPCGTLLYMSPEGYHGIRTLSDSQAKASDIYAYGLVLYELLTGLQSWQLERVVTPYQLFALVNEGRRPSWGVHREQIDPRYIQLVEACWSGKYEDRPTADTIITTLNELHASYEQSMVSAISSEYTTSESQMSQQEQVEPLQAFLEPEEEYDSYDLSSEAERRDEHQERATSTRPERSHESSPKTVHPPLLEGAVRYEEKLNNALGDLERTEYPEMNLAVENSGHEGNTLSAAQNNGDDEQVSADDIRDAVRHVDSQRIVDSSEAMPPNETVQYATNPQLLDSGSDYEEDFTNKEPANASQVEPEKVNVGRIQEEYPGSIRVQSVLAKPHGSSGNQDVHSHHPMGMKEFGEGGTLDEWDDTENNSFPMPEIRKVESEQIIKKPSLRLGIPPEGGEGASYGLQLNPDPNEHGRRSQTDIIKSFLRAAEPDVSGSSTNAGGPGMANAYGPGQYMVHDANKDPQGNFGIIGLAEFAKPAMKPPTPHLQLSAAFGNLGLGGANGGFNQGNQTAANHVMGLMQSNAPVNAAYQQMVDQRFTVTSGGLSQADLDMLDQECVNQTITGQALLPTALSNGNMYVNGHMPNSGATSGGYNGGHGAPNTSVAPMITGNKNIAPKPPRSDGINHPNRMSEPYNTFMGLGNVHAAMGMPSLITTASMGGGVPRIDESVVEMAMQHPNGITMLSIQWQNGHCRPLANSFAACKTLRGDYALNFVCQLLKSNNDLVEARRDRIVARDLCTAVGNLVRNSGYDLESRAVLQAIALILSSMSIFAHDKDLYAACTYALCNLLKVHNVLNDMSLRQTLATWISYCIMWNLSEGNNRGPKCNILAYSATCAARNLMWLNETNISTFLSASSNGIVSPIAHIIHTISLFDYLRQRKVVEACMSTLATVVYYPTYRASFAQQQGFECVSRIAEQYVLTSPKLARLALCVLGVALAGPHPSDEALEAVSKAFLEGLCVQKVMHTIEMVQQQQGGSLDQLHFVDLLESGFSVVLAGVSLGITVCQIFSNAGIGNMIMTSINDIARCNRVMGRVSLDRLGESRQSLTVTLCDTLSLLSCESNILRFFRESRADQVISELYDAQSSSQRVVQSCQSALEVLRANY